jgi:N-acetylneuraminate synthase/N,N'-diacetyllegionaminate synthase
MQDVNLLAMNTIQNELGVQVGYSDHTLGIEVPIAAVALGAVLIEKHFTLDRNLPGPDHLASLNPDELKSMVQSIRNIELAISGNGIKTPSESEINNIAIARKSIHITNDLPSGHIITESDLIALRPGDGISPMVWETIIGKKLTVNKIKFDKLKFSDIQ